MISYPYSADDLVEQAREAAGREEWSIAQDLYEQALVQEPSHAEASYGKAYVLRRMGEFKEARKVLDLALGDHPENAKLLAESGALSWGEGNVDEAESYFRRARAITPESKAATRGLADVFSATGREEQAESLLADLRRQYPDNPQIALQLAWARLRINQANGALSQFAHALSHKETAYSARLGIAAVHLLRRNFSGSKKSFREAIVERPEAAEAYCNLAWVYVLEQKDLDEAERLCRQTLDIDPNYASALDCLGVVFFQQENPRQAELYFKKAIDLAPKDAGIRVRLGLLYSQINDPAEAQRCFDEAIELDPGNELAFYSRGGVLYQGGELISALRDFQRAIILKPQSGLGFSGSALTLAKLGRLSEACSLLHSGLARINSRDCWQLRLTLAQVLVQAGEELKDDDLFHDALAQAERAILECKDSKELFFIAGTAAAKAKDYAKAEAFFQKTVNLDSLDLRAKRSLRLVQTLTNRRTRSEVVSPSTKWVLVAFLTAQIVAFWLDFPRPIGEVQFAALLPVFMGLILIVFFLPRLTELKLPGGFEAKIQVATEVNAAEVLIQLRPDQALPSLGGSLGLPAER